MAYRPKFKLAERIEWKEHRSGWGVAVSALTPLFTSRGVLLDVFIEKKFSMDVIDGRTDSVEPYREPWVGFLHYPPGIPEWHQYASSPQAIFDTEAWKQSLPWCRGLFVLSRWMKDWAQRRLNVPIAPVSLPTETAVPGFSWDAYLSNTTPAVIQLGWWLRRMHSIFELPTERLHKVMLTAVVGERRKLVERVMEQERRLLPLTPFDRDAVSRLPHLSDGDYDRLLSRNIVFLDLYDGVANNAVVECMARNTPILINPLPSVREYLGDGYPLYFRSLAEAARKAEDAECVRAAHEYLRHLAKDRLTAAHFLKSVAESDVYRVLDSP